MFDIEQKYQIVALHRVQPRVQNPTAYHRVRKIARHNVHNRGHITLKILHGDHSAFFVRKNFRNFDESFCFFLHDCFVKIFLNFHAFELLIRYNS